MNMIRHNHELTQFKFRILRRQTHQCFFNALPKLIQNTSFTNNGAQQGLIMRYLYRYKKSPPSIINILMTKRSMKIHPLHPSIGARNFSSAIV